MSVGTNSELDAEQVARALVARGSIREGIALLRAVVARDASEEGCAALLARVVSGALPAPEPGAPVLTLALVDAWIRRGMLVEALALLSGTEMARDETGREWASLLGELLAPVPVDAEAALVEMHRHLLTGGASVALTILEERARREPTLPAWASRRLAVLRWLLLDNASIAPSHPALSGVASTALAASVLDAVNRRDLRGGLEAARRLAAADPTDPEPPAVARCIAAILEEIEQHADEPGSHASTLPMQGRLSVALQLRMGNYAHAASTYAKLLAKREDPAMRRLLDAVGALLRATRGEPITERSEVTVGRHLRAQASPPSASGVGMPSRSGATDVIAEVDLDEPTAVVAMPLGGSIVEDDGATAQTPLDRPSRSEVLVSRIRKVE